MFLGLTGGIGTGKTTVLNCFSNYKWKTINADKLCHDLYNENGNKSLPCLIKKRWGEDVFQSDGSVDKNKVSAIVFKDKDELKWLNKIIHPKVWRKAENIYGMSNGKNCIFEVPLLFEAGWEKRFDAVVCVWTDKNRQNTFRKKREMSIQNFKLRLKFQININKKLEMADYALINTGNCSFLDKQISKLINQTG